jgi:hypothetical protein
MPGVPAHDRYRAASERRDIVVEVMYIVDAMEMCRNANRMT